MIILNYNVDLSVYQIWSIIFCNTQSLESWWISLGYSSVLAGTFSHVVHLDQSHGSKNIWWPELVSFTDSSSEDDEDDSVLTQAGRLLSGKADYLPSGILDVTRIKDANIDKPSNVSQKYNRNTHCRLYCSEEILLLAEILKNLFIGFRATIKF